MSNNNIETVALKVDLDKICKGQWFEIARFNSWFEPEETTDAVHTYTKDQDNHTMMMIKLKHTCKIHGVVHTNNASATVAQGCMDNSKLDVTFQVWPLSMTTHWNLLELWTYPAEETTTGKEDSDLYYYYAAVLASSQSKNYIWFLCREPTILQPIFDEMSSVAEKNGFDPKRLRKCSHTTTAAAAAATTAATNADIKHGLFT